jgi:hypothetical protein
VFHGDATKDALMKKSTMYLQICNNVRNMKFNIWNGDGNDRQIALKRITGSNN